MSVECRGNEALTKTKTAFGSLKNGRSHLGQRERGLGC
jgi:hypothetical protein